MIFPMMFLVLPLSPTRTEDHRTISKSRMFILLSAFKRMRLAKLATSIKILKMKWLAMYSFMTRPSYYGFSTSSLPSSSKDISFLLVKIELFFWPFFIFQLGTVFMSFSCRIRSSTYVRSTRDKVSYSGI